MKKRLKRILLLVLLLSGAAAIYGYFLYNKPHRNVEKEKGLVISADSLINLFVTDEDSANKLYLNKVIEVSGKVSEADTDTSGKTALLLAGRSSGMASINCVMEKSAPGIAVGTAIKIKGICTGYLTDVVLDRCVLVE